jgi:predicted nucleic acid-binding protein
MMRLVLDAEAVNALLDPHHPGERRVRHAMAAARRLGRDVVIATGTLAELYRGRGRNQALDALLARESKNGLLLRDTDRTLARLIGAVLAEAGASSALFADAHPVAVAVESGGGEIQTGDPEDLGRLAAPYRTIVIEPLARKKGEAR